MGLKLKSLSSIKGSGELFCFEPGSSGETVGVGVAASTACGTVVVAVVVTSVVVSVVVWTGLWYAEYSVVVLVAAPISPGYIKRYVSWVEAMELMNTTMKAITSMIRMITSVRFLRDVFIPSAFFRNVGFGLTIKS